MTNKSIVYQPIQPEIAELAAARGNNPEAVLEVLQDLQAERGGLSRPAISDAARALGLPPHKAFGIATFYSMLSLEERRNVLRVCDGPVCWLKRVSDRSSVNSHQLAEWQEKMGEDYTVERTSCLGLCDRAPAVLIGDEQAGPADPEAGARLCEGWRGVPTDYSEPRPREVRVMMRGAGKVNPDDIDSALEHGAYDGLKSALRRTPEEVIALVEESGLQGRGGAGFPVGRKWKFVAASGRSPRYMICNADESEPLIFK
ncbi:MAG: NAD(P)H-dependent oxidoreductase subunit E, partial [Chloroflexota bacterium]